MRNHCQWQQSRAREGRGVAIVPSLSKTNSCKMLKRIVGKGAPLSCMPGMAGRLCSKADLVGCREGRRVLHRVKLS